MLIPDVNIFPRVNDAPMTTRRVTLKFVTLEQFKKSDWEKDVLLEFWGSRNYGFTETYGNPITELVGLLGAPLASINFPKLPFSPKRMTNQITREEATVVTLSMAASFPMHPDLDGTTLLTFSFDGEKYVAQSLFPSISYRSTPENPNPIFNIDTSFVFLQDPELTKEALPGNVTKLVPKKP